jgi:hypothetical protein
VLRVRAADAWLWSWAALALAGSGDSSGKTFELKQAGYTPVVSDGKRLFMVGYYVLVGLEPTGR